ncbi:MAG: hypothetical protein NTZ65_00705 [Candidatus Berkelbacteria bacterium]|nr:hypothetical protein [Candidatus Berkelbacteria bacterium]
MTDSGLGDGSEFLPFGIQLAEIRCQQRFDFTAFFYGVNSRPGYNVRIYMDMQDFDHSKLLEELAEGHSQGAVQDVARAALGEHINWIERAEWPKTKDVAGCLRLAAEIAEAAPTINAQIPGPWRFVKVEFCN